MRDISPCPRATKWPSRCPHLKGRHLEPKMKTETPREQGMCRGKFRGSHSGTELGSPALNSPAPWK